MTLRRLTRIGVLSLALAAGGAAPAFAAADADKPAAKATNPPTTRPNAGTPDNTAPAGFTAAFNGKDLAGWKGLLKSPLDNPYNRAKLSAEELAKAQAEADENMRANWKVEDGALVFSGKGRSLCTAKDYGDFEMWVDWNIKEAGDSGVYVRGTPQIQIWDPNHKSAGGLGSGGLFNNQKKENPSKPLKKADRPIGEWNTFFIRMVGDRVTIYLNGELVVDNTVLENYWARQSKLGDLPLFPTGQIELQNHGNTLWFKNIYLRELGGTTGGDAGKAAAANGPAGEKGPAGPVGDATPAALTSVDDALKAMKDADPKARAAAAASLGKAGTWDAVAPLLAALDDEDRDVRAAAAAAMSGLALVRVNGAYSPDAPADERRAVIARWRKLAEDPARREQWEAWQKERRAPAPAGPTVTVRVAKPKPPATAPAVPAMGHATAMKSIADPDPKTRAAAAASLATATTWDVTEPLLAAMDDADRDVRAAAAKAIGDVLYLKLDHTFDPDAPQAERRASIANVRKFMNVPGNRQHWEKWQAEQKARRDAEAQPSQERGAESRKPSTADVR